MDLVKRILSRRMLRRGKPVIVLPSEKLVYAVKFVLGMTFFLTSLEVASMAFMHVWNSEVFICISGMIGTVTGIILAQKA